LSLNSLKGIAGAAFLHWAEEQLNKPQEILHNQTAILPCIIERWVIRRPRVFVQQR
jgi:hypothetical protein